MILTRWPPWELLYYVCQAVAKGRKADVTEAAIAEHVLNRRNFDPNLATAAFVRIHTTDP